jgi:hypothetical protein
MQSAGADAFQPIAGGDTHPVALKKADHAQHQQLCTQQNRSVTPSQDIRGKKRMLGMSGKSRSSSPLAGSHAP